MPLHPFLVPSLRRFVASAIPMPPEPADTNPVLYLIDGHAQIFRAYFAIRGGMSSPVTGEPTQAVFAFAGMLLKLYEQYRPDYVVMAIDMPGRTFRHDLYEDYKANREPPPDDFHPQEQRIYEMTRLFGIPLLGVPGAEADDVIATVTRRVLADGDHADLQIRIVSRDKDLEQLLGDRVCLFDIHKDQTVDAASLRSEKGIGPDQVIDALALMGDNVDNIVGVPGIGPKTAASLIRSYGSIDGVLAHLDEIKGKRRENLEAARDRLGLNRELVTLRSDVPLDFDLDAARCDRIDVAALVRLFETLGFRRHARDVAALGGTAVGRDQAAEPAADRIAASLFEQPPSPETTAPPPSPTHDGDYEAITTGAQLAALVSALRDAELISVDTETIGLGRQAPICGLSFAWRPSAGVYVPTASPDPGSHLDLDTVLDALRPVLEDPARPKCGHNLKYDGLVLRHATGARTAGITLRGIAFDSMVASQLLGFPGRGLDELAARLLDHTMIPISSLIGPRGGEQATMDQIPLDTVAPYAAEDADITLRLHDLLEPMVAEAGMAALAAVEMPLVEALTAMEYHGIRVDPDELLRQKQTLIERIDALRQRIYDAAGETFNLDSPRQLGDILFKKLRLPIGRRGKTGPSTDVEVLERLAAREDLPPEKLVVARLIVAYRQFTKLVNTYLDNLRASIDKADGRVHASFAQLGAATGRLSSHGPNLQNIPVRTDIGRQVRKAFVADPGHRLICADYSQIELRILAHLSEDPALLDAFRRDLDIHVAVAAEVYGAAPDAVTPEQRNNAKIVNFSIIYGVTPYGLARRIEGLDEAAAKALIGDYRRRFPGIDRFLHQCVEQALTHGHVETMLGRRRRIPQLASHSPATRALGERLAINTVVQGSATGDLIKTAMVNLHRRIHRDSLPLRLLVQIHDELLLEAPAGAAAEQAAIVRAEMEGAMQLRVPLKVDIGIAEDWLAAK